VASAILTVWNEHRYTVIDFRAVESLHRLKQLTTPRVADIDYLSYVAKCRELAETHDVSLRDLDRALWKWSAAGYPPE
jgi:hypothetical protein